MNNSLRERASQLFKRTYTNAFFKLLKAYKRHYFGLQLLALPYFKLTKNAVKIQKWQRKSSERREFFLNSLKDFKFYRQIYKKFYPQVKEWLNSAEFKQKYLNTKHPFPPLLNPDTLNDENSPLNYNNIPAEMAWNMNLPLPLNYDFMYISNGSSATAASFRFLLECNIEFGKNYIDIGNHKECFIWYYNTFRFLKQEQNIFFSYATPLVTTEYSTRLINSLPKKAPLLYIARDPIEKLQHAINHSEYGAEEIPKMRRYNLTCDYKKFFRQEAYWGGNGNTPGFGVLQNLSNNIALGKLVCSSLFNALKDKISFIHCVEFNDLKYNKAFETFVELSAVFGFKKPQNKEIFTNRINRCRGTLAALPITIYAHNEDINNCFVESSKNKENLISLDKENGFNVIITLPHYVAFDDTQEFIDISDKISQNLIIDETKVLILVEKDKIEDFKRQTELYNITLRYIKDFVRALNNHTSSLMEQFIDERQILEFLKQNSAIRKTIKHILDNELIYIKQNHPEFIQKWKYYLEFERMCEELDGAQNKGEK